MRTPVAQLALAWIISVLATIGAPPAPQVSEHSAVTFRGDIGPLLKANCTPCHFKGGKVFDRLPFDQYETARKLGARLNTRLKGASADLVTRWIKAGAPK